MPFVILGLLLSGPLSLYDLHKRFRAGVSLFYSASYGSIQRNLAQLVAQGDVTVEEDAGSTRGRKLHSITPSGCARWHAWMLAPIPAGADAETLTLAKVFLLGRLEPSDRSCVLEEAAARADASLRELEALSAELDTVAADIPAEQADAFAYQRAVLDYGIRSSRLAADWVDGLRAVAS